MIRRPDWPQQVRDVQLGLPEGHVRPHFKLTPAERHAARKPSAQMRRPGMDPAHLGLIRQLPCTVCPAISRIDPHHLKSLDAGKERAFGRRSTDRRAVPICRFHHEEVERAGSRNELAWFDRWGLDPHALANALWANTGDLARMGRVLIAHKQAAVRELGRRAQVNVLVAHGLTRAEAEEQYEFTRNGRR